jgi:tRNA(Arg) A34 adenosine deaminase TadA
MCLGALYWARPSKIYFANTREDAALIGFDDAMIYKELTQPYANRKIPMLHVHSEQALQLFKQWQLKANKQMY